MQRFRLQESLTNMGFIENRYNMVMTRGRQPQLALYDTSLPPDRNDGIDSFERLLQMDGHQTEGYGMDWNLHRDAYAISADFSGLVCVWDISSASKLDKLVRPVQQFRYAADGVYVASLHSGREVAQERRPCFLLHRHEGLHLPVGDY